MKLNVIVSRLLSSVGLFLVLLAVGCASTSTSTVRQPFTSKLGQFKSAAVEVKSTVAKPPAKLDEFMVQLESRIIAKLRSQNAFEKIFSASSDAPSELQITVTLTQIRDVNTFNRVMWGAMAGTAKSEALLEIRERSTGKLIGANNILGKSSGGSVFAGTTAEAVERVADEVVRQIQMNH